MSGRNKYRGNRNRGGQQTLSSVARSTATSLPADSPLLGMFKQAALKLNDRQDRHERLVKLSRDVTIESKRIIFLLHSAITKESSLKAIQEANERLEKLRNGSIKSIGLELENSPAYLHSRAVTAGFQEYVEARTLCSLVANNEIIGWPEVQKEFQFEITETKDENEGTVRTVVTMITHGDYLLGLADLTGELMRRAINCISSGDSEECFQACQVVRALYTGYLGLFGTSKELARKLSVTRANVAKVEAAIYALRVRGDEAPPPLLLAASGDWDHGHHSDDEGYY